MELSLETLERELKASEAAYLAHEEGMAIHKIVKEAFKKAFDKAKSKQ